MDRFFAALLAGVMDGASYGLIALGLVLVYKSTRVLNFAQAEIGTIGIYIVWELSQLGVPVPIGVVVALVAGALMGAGTELVLRPLSAAPRLTVTVATLGIGTLLGAYQVLQFNPDPHVPPDIIPGSRQLFGITVSNGRVLALFVTAALGFGLYMFFKRSLFGLGVLASAQDQTALRLMGVPLNRVSMFTWATGGALTVLAGVILAPTVGTFTPFFITANLLVQPLAAALVGGLTSLPGVFVGGIIVGIAENLAKFYWAQTVPGAEYGAVFAAILLVLLLKPNGLLGREA